MLFFIRTENSFNKNTSQKYHTNDPMKRTFISFDKFVGIWTVSITVEASFLQYTVSAKMFPLKHDIFDKIELIHFEKYT